MKTVGPLAWTWPSTAVDNSPKRGFIALLSTPQLPPPTSGSPCSASDGNIGVGNFWGAWPWPAQPSSFRPRLLRVEGDVPAMWAGAVQGIWVAPAHCKLPQRPASDHTCVWSLSVWLNPCWEVQSLLLIPQNIVCPIIHFFHSSALNFFIKIFVVV